MGLRSLAGTYESPTLKPILKDEFWLYPALVALVD